MLLATLSVLAVLVGRAAAHPPAMIGWDLEKDVDVPSYAVAEPMNAGVDIDTIVLTCEQGQRRPGLQLRLYPMGGGPLASRAAAGVEDPTLEFAVDGVRYAMQLLFADSFIVVADSADGAVPLLSEALLDVIQAGRRMELRFSSVESLTIVDLQAGRGGAAVAAVRRCAGKSDRRIAETGAGRS
ncbi:MAG: hypothetical protein ACT4O6_04245 [Reyranella sp.]